MRNMKKIFVLLIVAATMLAQDAFAQTPTPEQKREDAKARREQLMQTRLELLKTELELTDEQLAKLEPIYRRFMARCSALQVRIRRLASRKNLSLTRMHW
jgi:hypothetical protein